MDETNVIRVRYWAAAKAAAGTAEDLLPATAALTLADVRRQALALHPGTRLEQVLAACSVLIGDEPVGSRADDQVHVEPGTSVEFLPPFAGG
jgi:molybdopterin synthase sulfur carrier subunit